MTVQGRGGWLAQRLGYPIAVDVRGSFELASLAVWIGFAGIVRPACAVPADTDDPAREGTQRGLGQNGAGG